MTEIYLPALKVHPGRPMPMGASVRDSGVQFALYSRYAERVWLALFEDIDDARPVHEFALDPAAYRFGDVWSAFIEGVKPGALYAFRVEGPFDPDQGHHFDSTRYLLDPYARCIVGDVQRGRAKGVVIDEPPTHRPARPPRVPMTETIIYETHLRGITADPSSGVDHPGTYLGLIEKIPYLKELGVTTVELLPIHQVGKRDLGRRNPLTGERLCNYWNYDPIGYFAPMAHFASDGGRGEQVAEFRAMVDALHQAGLEVILDVVFNHTGEGDARGLTLSFKGIDCRTYYMIGPDGAFRDYTGCENTFNCNHPVVQDLIVEALRHWVVDMHVDGFRFDLATVLARDTNGNLMERAPLIERITHDPVLRDAKLIAEAWDCGGGYLVGRFNGRRWAEWNDRYRDDTRAFWVGNNGAKQAFAKRIVGSPDLFGHGRSPLSSINFVTCHDGFTLRDLVSYNEKHNEANGEENRDGSNHNQSWNFGVEGETDDPAINAMRLRMQKNFIATLFLSVGVPMFLGGDEFGRTQGGNNNPYCQDNATSWYDWTLTEKNAELLRFTREVIRFRKANPAFTRGEFLRDASGTPPANGKEYDVLWLNAAGKPQEWRHEDPSLGAWVNGACNGGTSLYILYNSSLDPIDYRVPEGPWEMRINTAKPSPHDIVGPGEGTLVPDGKPIRLSAKSMVVLAVHHAEDFVPE